METRCTHHRRKCHIKVTCCQGTFGCLKCHNEQSTHKATIRDIEALVCLNCSHEQKGLLNTCQKCHAELVKYSCGTCHLMEDEDRGQFHCEGCGLCRLGGKVNYFHCDTCQMCLPNSLMGSHKCIERVSHSNCPVCQDDLHTSKEPCQIPPCQHLIHKGCFDGLIANSLFYCPICSRSLLDLSPLWKVMSKQIEKYPMHGKYQDITVNVICRDCCQSTKSPFHVIGLLCKFCQGFNTVRADEKYFSLNNVELDHV